jgi:high-affinity nickel permease
MKRTPRYIRLMSLGVSVAAFIGSHATMRQIAVALGDSPNLLDPLIQLSYLTLCLALVSLVNLAWLFNPQEERSN